MNILLGSFKDSWAPPNTGPVSDPQGVALLPRQRMNFVRVYDAIFMLKENRDVCTHEQSLSAKH